MSWLFEDPTTLIVVGVLIEALLAVALVNSRQTKLAWAMLGVMALMMLGLSIERLVITDYEQIESILDATAASLAANDVEGVLAKIDPEAAGMRQQVQATLSHAHVSAAHIRDLSVRFHRLTSPPTARAEFIGNVKGSFRTGVDAGDGTVIRRITVDFVRRGDRWLMTGYEDLGPPIGPGRAHGDD